MGSFIVVVFGVFLALLASGIWVGVAAALIGMSVLYSAQGWDAMIQATAWVVWMEANNYTFTILPLFILMGLIMTESGLGKRIYSSIAPLLDHFPGGLHYANIIAGMLFAATSGSAVAATATIGSVALPEMEKRGYSYADSAGSVAAGAVLSPLIPPSMLMIFYASLVEVSIGRQFIAGIIPGLLLTGLFLLYIILRFSFSRGWKEIRGEMLTWKASLAKSVEVWPILFLIALVLGSIFIGIATATEAAGMGAFGVILLASFYRNFNWPILKKAAFVTMRMTCQLMFIYIGCKIMAAAFARVGLVTHVTEFFLSLPVSPIMVLIMIWVVFLIMGMLLEAIPMLLMIVPVVFPTIEALGYDPIWFGIIVVLLCLIGNFTPPVGVSLFAMQSLRPDKPLTELYRGLVPYGICLFVLLVILTVFPDLTLLLPRIMLGK